MTAAALLAGTAACTSGGSDGSEGGGSRGDRAPRTLRVLASSELADLKPVLEQAREATGVTVKATWTGTLDAVEQVASGKADGRYDAVWLASNDYLRLRPAAAGKIGSETPLMSSPVALGVKKEAVERLGWQPDEVTWSQIHRAAADGKLSYGMTDPLRSNSGFAALISTASALSDAQSALREEDVREAAPELEEFFAGQKLTSGSSGWLASAYERRGSVDALINYESVLLSMNRDRDTGLTVIRPKDGVVTADYPLTHLASASEDARDSAGTLARHLRSPEAQRAITEQTFRRPVVASVEPAAGLSQEKRHELPFPGSQSVADGLLAAYENELRRPSRTVYVLDTSGSMAGGRLEKLKKALTRLAGADTSPAGERFRDREEVTLMPFGTEVKRVRTHTVPEERPAGALGRIRGDADSLTAAGNTSIFSSLEEAYRHLDKRESALGDDRFTSIVLMTDGQNTTGTDAAGFESFYRGLPERRQEAPVFPILFGDSDHAELTSIAELTGGRLFDANEGSLAGAFEEIRGYQ
ncbi:substrate-binding and VWA domain-containing protein [Streptomyces sp. N2-109]|uniref:Substrate-binding and VWA domain-containing protein n=1 Tax=Streptomyces gossypii TaxID=2883101 RepID=A0ABT2K029_9ACTN|nr:substrate-binding and VWA domain-containing protein [Streptomyces gossypii]MCT2592809.1 substrate-binding and VWA domain-containing protein [Streptomyces gossypii]